MTEQSSTKERNVEIDILKGFGIALMVFNHVGWGGIVHSYIQSFHMPLFFIVSGFLFKEQEITEMIKKRFRTLIVPYLVFSAFFLLLAIVEGFVVASSVDVIAALKAILLFPTDKSNIPIASALWFLPCMFFSSLLFLAIERYVKSETNKYVIIIVIAILGAVYSAGARFYLPLCIQPLTAALLFMKIGQFVKRYSLLQKIEMRRWLIPALIIIECASAIWNGNVDLRSARFHIVPLYFINAIIATVGYWGLAHLLYCADKTNRAPQIVRRGVLALCYLSRNALSFLCLNQLFIVVVSRILAMIKVIDNYVLLHGTITVIVFTLCCLSNELITRTRLKFVIGK